MIKNLIFDFGGVIYDIDHNISRLAFESLGVKQFEKHYGHEKQSLLFEKFERGEINEAEFRLSLKKFLPNNTSDQKIDEAWCALLIGFNTEKIDLLEKLGKTYKVFLLSNTNIIHTKQFMRELNTYKDFKSLFVDTWLSYEKGMRKPEKNFYLGLLEKHQLNANESLFIDDLDVNIEAAKKLGIQTHYLQNGEAILDLFVNGLLK